MGQKQWLLIFIEGMVKKLLCLCRIRYDFSINNPGDLENKV
ncbi:MAG: hypothetical protein ACD_21C00158G0005 [uncultured bacterium]|nr:MAG: hypothetical protein ACD_21C00158G0005 [uncultured bacterium]